MNPGYNPQQKTKMILDWCLKRIQSVPYRVTSRWLFYRYVEEILKPSGMTTKTAKKEYKNFLSYTSRARKRFYNGWKPDTLIDDTRDSTIRGFGYANENRWLESFKRKKAVFDKYRNQDHVVEVWFEAQAMYSQFAFYTEPYHITLRPFKGDASIDYKWQIAKHLEIFKAYNKPIVILYFGDLDAKGLSIPRSAIKDIREWCGLPFTFVRCGINKDQVVEWGIIEAFDKEETYQWEALDEDKAKALIVGNVEKYWSLEKIKEVENTEYEATRRWVTLIERSLKR